MLGGMTHLSDHDKLVAVRKERNAARRELAKLTEKWEQKWEDEYSSLVGDLFALMYASEQAEISVRGMARLLASLGQKSQAKVLLHKSDTIARLRGKIIDRGLLEKYPGAAMAARQMVSRF